MFIGVGKQDELIFEGVSNYGARVIWPLPLLTPAKFAFNTSLNTRLVPDVNSSLENSEYLFREDAFDPVTRIRRGRFYKRNQGSQPARWTLRKPPPIEVNSRTEDVDAYTFSSVVPSELAVKGNQQLLVILGAGEAFSIWTVVNKETVHTREILVTLKSRQSFGALPEIDWNLVPDKSGLVKGKIESLLDDIYRAGAESIVDRAREAATAILSAHLQSKGEVEANGKDLGALIELLENRNDKNSQRIIRCAAEIPQRLHSRGKHAEQERRDNLRPICEQDAELAVQCIGVMLCDLGWARWL